MTTTFITGANKSLGYETARRLSEAGHTVLLGARNRERGQAAAEALGVRFVQIDVSDSDSVKAAAADVLAHEGVIDVLVNNAGITGPHKPVQELTAEDYVDVLNTNAVGIVRTTHAFLPLLQKSANPVVVNVTSGLGSFAATNDPSRIESTVVLPFYNSSKSAVTMLTTQYAKAFPDIKFNAVDPGYTATDLNQHGGTQTVTEGTDAIVTFASLGTDGPTGEFHDRHGVVAW